MLHLEIAKGLRDRGHDVLHATEADQARADDREILERVIQENRILITFDQHFGNWAVLPLDRHPGVIRLCLDDAKHQEVVEILTAFLEDLDADAFINFLAIITESNVRWINTAKE